MFVPLDMPQDRSQVVVYPFAPVRAGVPRWGEALPGVDVSVRNGAQFGTTRTREDGRFDLAVNGGRPRLLRFEARTELATGETTRYHYDALGSLRAVEVPDGREVTCDADGPGRRVARAAVPPETDHLGSVRRVVDAETAVVVQRPERMPRCRHRGGRSEP